MIDDLIRCHLSTMDGSNNYETIDGVIKPTTKYDDKECKKILLDCDQSKVLLASIVFFLHFSECFFVSFGLY